MYSRKLFALVCAASLMGSGALRAETPAKFDLPIVGVDGNDGYVEKLEKALNKDEQAARFLTEAYDAANDDQTMFEGKSYIRIFLQIAVDMVKKAFGGEDERAADDKSGDEKPVLRGGFGRAKDATVGAFGAAWHGVTAGAQAVWNNKGKVALVSTGVGVLAAVAGTETAAQAVESVANQEAVLQSIGTAATVGAGVAGLHWGLNKRFEKTQVATPKTTGIAATAGTATIIGGQALYQNKDAVVDTVKSVGQKVFGSLMSVNPKVAAGIAGGCAVVAAGYTGYKKAQTLKAGAQKLGKRTQELGKSAVQKARAIDPKKVGLGVAGVAGLGGLGYGAYKVYDTFVAKK